ncbi:MAG TPA: dTDP-4-dehydrorhamnose reductase [Ramlibacter sp.]|jgi:dTDP-4-dehydrorhamnose reductase|nr:dTDP-4-dehydrorhamnose reductase [Ramlibacter sp.]
MKILLFGRNGQVGWELQRSLAPLGEVVALGSSGEGDLRDPAQVAATLRATRPQLVVNAAAYTAVDRAESEPELAHTINAEAPAAMAAAAHAVGAALVHFSTDYVFDGSGSRPWREDDPTGPLNVYGRTKLAGEQGVRAAAPLHLVLRTSWVYGRHGANFAKTMLRLAREREQLTVVDDQFGAPTGAELLADVTAHAVRTLLARPELAGTYHVAAAGETSWHGYARHLVGKAQQRGEMFKVGPDQVLPVPSSSFRTAARRPDNSRLDTSRFCQAFGLVLPPWQHGVDRLLQELL